MMSGTFIILIKLAKPLKGDSGTTWLRINRNCHRIGVNHTSNSGRGSMTALLHRSLGISSVESSATGLTAFFVQFSTGRPGRLSNAFSDILREKGKNLQRHLIRMAVFILLTNLFCGLTTAWAQEDMSRLQRGVVRIYTVAQEPDYQIPWSPGSTQSGFGSGFIVSGQRILTNAHVVSNANFITVEKEGDARRYEARVQFIAHDCDLAIVEVVDKAFFNNTTTLALGGVPALDSLVTVLGYPIGGDRLSVTRGIVSRIDYRVYAHSGVDSHLVIQIDAAINPGNSGGPVLQDNHVIGVAFQGFSGMVAQNVGYMIPVPVIQRFMQDVTDGRYDFYVDLGISYFPLINTAHRRALDLDPGDFGVMVGDVIKAGAAADRLQTEDVMLSIDDHHIFSDGRVAIGNDRLMLNEIVERKFKGDTVKVDLQRKGEPLTVTLPLNTPWPYLMQANRYDVLPRFLVFGGLVFQPLSKGLYSSLPQQSATLRYYYRQFLDDELYLKHPEVVVISRILPDPVNSHLNNFTGTIVEQVNDVPIKTMQDLAHELDKPADFYVIRVVGDPQPLVLEAQAVAQARERVIRQYGITSERYLDGGIVPKEWLAVNSN